MASVVAGAMASAAGYPPAPGSAPLRRWAPLRLRAVLSFAGYPQRQESSRIVAEAILFFALVLSAGGLIAAILMQSRGSGLGSTFGGGDSSTYRSRRGVEARLYQLTVVLSVVFVAVSMLVYIASL